MHIRCVRKPKRWSLLLCACTPFLAWNTGWADCQAWSAGDEPNQATTDDTAIRCLLTESQRPARLGVNGSDANPSPFSVSVPFGTGPHAFQDWRRLDARSTLLNGSLNGTFNDEADLVNWIRTLDRIHLLEFSKAENSSLFLDVESGVIGLYFGQKDGDTPTGLTELHLESLDERNLLPAWTLPEERLELLIDVSE